MLESVHDDIDRPASLVERVKFADLVEVRYRSDGPHLPGQYGEDDQEARCTDQVADSALRERDGVDVAGNRSQIRRKQRTVTARRSKFTSRNAAMLVATHWPRCAVS